MGRFLFFLNSCPYIPIETVAITFLGISIMINHSYPKNWNVLVSVKRKGASEQCFLLLATSQHLSPLFSDKYIGSDYLRLFCFLMLLVWHRYLLHLSIWFKKHIVLAMCLIWWHVFLSSLPNVNYLHHFVSDCGCLGISQLISDVCVY